MKSYRYPSGTILSLSPEGNKVPQLSCMLQMQTHKREVVFPVNSLTGTIKCRFTHSGHQAGVPSLKENKISSVPTIKPLISFGQVTADNG